MFRLLLAAVIAAGFAAPAFADALVVVEVRTPSGANADGRVVLTPRGGGASYACQTQNGGCRIEGVPGGHYAVAFTGSGGQSSSTSAVIPPEGRVTLHVAAP